MRGVEPCAAGKIAEAVECRSRIHTQRGKRRISPPWVYLILITMATWASCGEVQTNWRRLIWTATALIAGLWYPPPARAGFCTAHRTDRENRHDLQFFAGYSPLSPTLIGTETSRRFVLAGLSYGYRCWTWDSVSISYTAAVMPASILIQPAQHFGLGHQNSEA